MKNIKIIYTCDVCNCEFKPLPRKYNFEANLKIAGKIDRKVNCQHLCEKHEKIFIDCFLKINEQLLREVASAAKLDKPNSPTG